MPATNRTYSLQQQGSSIFMMLALIWLTVSLPVVTQAGKWMAVQENRQGNLAGDEQNANPFAGNTEEKSPSAGNALSEYLHEITPLRHPGAGRIGIYNIRHCSLYTAFHGELLVPPPNC